MQRALKLCQYRTWKDVSKYTPKEWENLQGKIIKNKNVILTRYGDIHPFPNGPKFECENLILNNCNKNFVYYWLDKKTFPKVKNVFLGSHPCEFEVLARMDSDIYVHDMFERYTRRGGNQDRKNVKVILDEDYQKVLNDYDSEELIE